MPRDILRNICLASTLDSADIRIVIQIKLFRHAFTMKDIFKRLVAKVHPRSRAAEEKTTHPDPLSKPQQHGFEVVYEGREPKVE